LQEVDALADRLLFVRNGRLVYDAPIGEARRGGESLEELFHRLTDLHAGEWAPAAAPVPPEVQP
jgi:ABC-type multidrug transport system ATPase subunit